MINETGVARAQIGLAYMYGLGFLGVLAALIFAPPTMDEFTKGMLQSLLGGLIVLVTQQSGYFFARQRPQESIPGEVTVKTTPPTTTVVTTPNPTKEPS